MKEIKIVYSNCQFLFDFLFDKQATPVLELQTWSVCGRAGFVRQLEVEQSPITPQLHLQFASHWVMQ